MFAFYEQFVYELILLFRSVELILLFRSVELLYSFLSKSFGRIKNLVLNLLFSCAIKKLCLYSTILNVSWCPVLQERQAQNVIFLPLANYKLQ